MDSGDRKNKVDGVGELLTNAVSIEPISMSERGLERMSVTDWFCQHRKDAKKKLVGPSPEGFI